MPIHVSTITNNHFTWTSKLKELIL